MPEDANQSKVTKPGLPTVAEAKRRAAIVLLIVLGAALLIALAPYAQGVVMVPVFYIMLAPLHRWLARRIGAALAASVVIIGTLVALVILGGTFAGLIVNEGQRVASSVTASPFLAQLADLKVGSVDVGAQITAAGSKAVAWIGSSAFALLGSVSRVVLNLTVAFFGVFYLLIRPGETWTAIRPYIPFSADHAEELRRDFRDVTMSMLLGTGLTAVVHGVMVGLAFRVAGLPNAAFWGLIAVFVSALPPLGSQPFIAQRVGHVHPLVSLVGTLIGIPYFGILGLLVGPLALAYFFALVTMFREEYLLAA